MGQLTRTQFGCTKTVTLTRAQIIEASNAPLIIVPDLQGKTLWPLFAFFQLNWAQDFSNIDGSADWFFDLIGDGSGSPALFSDNGSIPFALAGGASAVVPFGLGTELNTAPSLLSDCAGLPIFFTIDNKMSGPLEDGVGNTALIEVHYVVI